MREKKYDLMKTIAIWLVCCYHFSWVVIDYTYPKISILSWIKTAIVACNTMAVPLFFMVNGILLAKKELNIKKHYKKCGLLIFQYIVWRSITIFVLAIDNGIQVLNQNEGKLEQVINHFFLFDNIAGIDMGHLWFIPALIGIYIICPFLIEKKEENIILGIVLIITTFFRWNLNHFAYIEPYILKIDLDGLRDFSPISGIIAIMLVYFIIGILIEKYKFDLKLMILLILFIVGVNWLVLEHVLFIKSGNMYDLVFDSYSSTATLISTTAIFLILNKLNNENIEKFRIIDKLVKVVGTNTLTVYYMHFIIGCTILKCINHGEGVGINSIKALVMILICSFIGEVGKKIPIIRRLFY